MEELLDILYHSISQYRLKGAVELNQLPDHSHFHHDTNHELRGIWLGDDLKPLLKASWFGKN